MVTADAEGLLRVTAAYVVVKNGVAASVDKAKLAVGTADVNDSVV
jgi:hypothetical protein